MKTIAVANHKGGVGKTTSAANVGAGIANAGYKTLLVDLDSQANLTQHFGFFDVPKSIYTAFSENSSGKLPIMEVSDNLFLVPSELKFARMEVELISRPYEREKVLLKLLDQVKELFDFCIIDCPPSVGVITQNALVACDTVVVPMEAEFFSFNGIKSIIDALNQVKVVNENISIAGVFVTKFERRQIAKAIRKEIDSEFGNIFINIPVRKNVEFTEAQSNGIDVFRYAPKGNGANDYRRITEELLKRVS